MSNLHTVVVSVLKWYSGERSIRYLGKMAKSSAIVLGWTVFVALAGTRAKTAAQQPQTSGTVLAGQPAVSAAVSGTVVDQSGAAVGKARVSLAREGSSNARSTEAGQRGEFTFVNVPNGTYRVIAQAIGFATAVSDPVSVADGQAVALPAIALSVAVADTEVNVVANDPVIAQQQMKAEEKQRVLGVIPNFYISYVRDPEPLNTRQKYSLAVRDTFDPVGFAGTAAGAGFEQWNHIFPGYGYGWSGYAKRYAALFGDGLTSDILSHAVFPSIFHQDPRYFYQGTGTVKSRLKHAVAFAFVTRADDGRTVPNYSYLLGDLGSGTLSNLYYPHADRGVGLIFLNAGVGVIGQAVGAIAEEFLSKFVTSNIPGKSHP